MMSLWPKMDLKKEAEVKDLLSCLPQFLKADVGTCQAEFENTVRLYKIVLFSKKNVDANIFKCYYLLKIL
jgi:hypothetical protein